MNKLLGNVRYTLRSTFDFYSALGKRLYANSFVFILLTGVVGGLIAAGIVLAMGHLFKVEHITLLGTEDYPFYRLLSTPQFLGLAQGIIILLLSLYGIALYRKREANEPIRSNLSFTLSSITTGEWKVFTICLLILIAVHLLLFINPFAEDPNGLLGLFDNLVAKFTFRGLAIDITEVLKNLLLPCFLAMLVVLYSMWGRLGLDIIREYRSAYVASILLLFSLNSIFSAANTLFQDTVVRLLTIPVIASTELSEMSQFTTVLIWLITILGIVCGLMIAALFYPALALSLISPFRYEEKQLEEGIKKDEGTESETDSLGENPE